MNAGFESNHVRTHKYTTATFVPKFLLESFRKAANMYFLAVCVLQCVKSISNTNGLPTTLPTLVFILLVDAAFAIQEDKKRHVADHVANHRMVHLLRHPSSSSSICQSSTGTDHSRATSDAVFTARPWADLRVGDYVQLFNREVIPADILILAVDSRDQRPQCSSSHNDDGGHRPFNADDRGANETLCYVETKSLDGESNMKVREALDVTATRCRGPADLLKLRGLVLTEPPNNHTHSFSGVLTLDTRSPTTATTSKEGTVSTPITLTNMLLRGCTLRNTEFVYGVVVSTGGDTKIMRSNKPTASKVSRLDSCVNQYIGVLILMLIACCLMAATGNLLWLYFHESRTPYLALLEPPSSSNTTAPSSSATTSALTTYGTTFFYYFLLMYQFIPISLYVSIASVKYIQACFMMWDVDMYHAASNTPALVRCMALNEELGQVTHVFSDKTGTLTCNTMEFRKCSIGGVSYGRGSPPARYLSWPPPSPLPKPLPTTTTPHVNFHGPELYAHMDGAVGADQAKRIDLFLTVLAVCHTVLPETPSLMTSIRPSDVDSDQVSKADCSDPALTAVTYSAASPDEQALVCAAAFFKYAFVSRTQKTTSVRIHDSLVTFDTLAILEFNSTRKRMSVVVRSNSPSRTIYLFTKGADGVVMPRLAPPRGTADRTLVDLTNGHISAYAKEGLRTLAVAYKELSASAFSKWSVTYDAAVASLDDMERFKSGQLPNAIDECMDELEVELHLLGATAIEDKLQDGVPEAVGTLIDAGMKLWMLTGDKDETAINIGYACNLLQQSMRLITLTAKKFPTAAATSKEITDQLYQISISGSAPISAPKMSRAPSLLRSSRAPSLRSRSRTKSHLTLSQSRISLRNTSADPTALVVDGDCVYHVMRHCPTTFLNLAQKCKVVLACRVSPAQKAALVALVKENVPSSRTLSIGDGANDVPMIQEAHIGVGISGQEGLQAVNASDYALAQFKFLRRLLLVHGRANYERLAKLVLYIVYKNILLLVAQFAFSMQTGLSGQKMYLEWGVQVYNVLLTAAPIVALAVMDHDVRDEIVLRLPALYRSGPLNVHINHRMFGLWVLSAVVEAVTIVLVSVAALENSSGVGGESPGLWFLGNIVMTLIVVAANTKLVFVHHRFNGLNPVLLVGSVAMWVATAVTASHFPLLAGINWYNMVAFTLAQPVVWITVPFVIVVVTGYSFVVRAIAVTWYPSASDIVKEFVLVQKTAKKSPSQRVTSRVRIVESLPLGDFDLAPLPNTIGTAEALALLFDSAIRQLDICAMYWNLLGAADHAAFSPDQMKQFGADRGVAVLAALRRAIKRGVVVRIVGSTTFAPFPELDGLDVELRLWDASYWYGGGIMHQKLVLVDQQHAYLGSANMDWKSMAQVMEVGVVVERSRAIVLDMQRLFNLWWLWSDPVLINPLDPTGVLAIWQPVDTFVEKFQAVVRLPPWTSSLVPSGWSQPNPFNATFVSSQFNKDNQITAVWNGERSQVFVSAAPEAATSSTRTFDEDGLIYTIQQAKKTVCLSVMDFVPYSTYKLDSHNEGSIYWPALVDTMLQVVYARPVAIRILVSRWAHTSAVMIKHLKILQTQSRTCPCAGGVCLGNITVRLFEVPGWDDTGDHRKWPAFSRVNHAKYIVTDGRANVGTSNMEWGYFYNTAGTSFNTDNTEVIDSLQKIFDRNWDSPYAIPLYTYR
ncbi:hypothetical protein DYB31_000347 [Aphanomyces astaci]|uniref:Phospholipid-transporting ATPase n=1 Tax=Aphanomyces astaci TaxID=112090 RepID=A0A397FGE5_APHAT|nr:hypothetical protein DYB31_000347 [Aphanomyces astaci]